MYALELGQLSSCMSIIKGMYCNYSQTKAITPLQQMTYIYMRTIIISSVEEGLQNGILLITIWNASNLIKIASNELCLKWTKPYFQKKRKEK